MMVAAASERRRRAAFIAGLALWSAHTFVFLAARAGEHELRCTGSTFTGGFDECFNDALPALWLPIGYRLAWIGWFLPDSYASSPLGDLGPTRSEPEPSA